MYILYINKWSRNKPSYQVYIYIYISIYIYIYIYIQKSAIEKLCYTAKSYNVSLFITTLSCNLIM